MELHDYLRLMADFEELIQREPAHLRLGKTLEFVRDNFKPEDVFGIIKQMQYAENQAITITPKTPITITPNTRRTYL